MTRLTPKDWKEIESHCYAKGLHFSNQFTEEESDEMIKRLAELEDKIEKGELVKLPCKMGDRVYYIDEYIAEFDKVEEYMVEKIEIVKDGIRLWFGDNVGYALTENFGKEVFLDKAQAEARLKELQEL